MVSQETIELAARAGALYDLKFRKQLEATNQGDFVAVEPESEQIFLGKTLSEARQAPRAAFPDRLTFVLRVGHKAAVELGAMTRI